jgi:NDP-sugar pyrophosphorylase family protein
MIETQIYPKLASEKQLYALPLRDNFFFDIGKPADYLLAQGAYLEHHKITSPQTG